MSEWAVTLVCGMLGVQTTILIAAIPWAYSMHGRVTRIEASAATAADLIDRVSSLESRLLRIEVELENG
jgi:thiamine pyrophosphate-dependent acetolactate synthase large subunit-like protein